MSNLDLYNKVKTPDMEFVKKVNMRGGFTNIDAQYLIMLATEQFGPYGKGFGLSESELDHSLLESVGVVTHKAKFFYVIDGERSEFPINNAIQAKTPKGFFDVDFAKKIETNTLGKALSKLGFASDVYMGKFDDQDYVQEKSNEQAMAKADNKDAERVKQIEAHNDWKEKELKALELIPNAENLKLVWTKQIRKLERMGDKDGVVAFNNKYKECLAKLEAK